MKSLGKDALKDFFNEQNGKSDTDKETLVLLQNISRTLRDMQDIGIDVTFDISSSCAERHFSLFADKNRTISASGMMNIEGQHRLFAVLSKFEDQKCLKIAVSEMDMRYEDIYAEISNAQFIKPRLRSHVFNCKVKHGFINFQKWIVETAASQQRFDQQDVANSFKKDSFRALKFHKG